MGSLSLKGESAFSKLLWQWGPLVVTVFMGLMAIMSITVIVSDICVDNTPIGVKQSYRMITPAVLGKLLLSYLLYFLLVVPVSAGVQFLGALLIALPRWWALAGNGLLAVLFLLIAVVLPMFFPTVIVLEGKWGFNAIRRSVQLGRGFHLRNLGILTIFFLCFFTAWIIALFLVMVIPPPFAFLLRLILVMLFYFTFICFPIICVVLMYYDMRVRKESYDTAALAEDLKL
jgi:hypothetical protein